MDCCIKVSNYKTRNRKLHAAINFGVGGTVVSSLATALFSRRRQLVGVTSNFSNNKYFAILELHALSPLHGSISPWYYFDHRFQKCQSRVKHKCQQCNREKDVMWWEKSGSASSGLPMMEWPGVRASTPSSSWITAVKGWLFRQTSIWVSSVDIL